MIIAKMCEAGGMVVWMRGAACTHRPHTHGKLLRLSV